jgi:hypothetical protein
LIDAGAIDRNFERWDILGQYVWPNDAPYPSTYEGEVRRLTDWIKASNSWMNVDFELSSADRCGKLADEKIPLRPFDTDKFEAGEPTTIRAVRGYAKYLWNDEIETDTYELNVSKGGNYWVKVFDETGCSNAVSDTLKFVAKAAINWLSGDNKFEYDGQPKSITYTTVPPDLNTKNSYILNGNEETEAVHPGTYVMRTSIDEAFYKGESRCEFKILGIVLSESAITLHPNSEYTLSAMIQVNETDIVEWLSSDQEVATVDSYGKISVLKTGSTNITVKTDDNKYAASCLITVTDPVRMYVNEISGNEKWLEIYNEEDATVDLTGYVIQKIDEKNKAEDWPIPAGTTVEAKGFRVWEQGGNSQESFTWGISAKKDVAFKIFDNTGAELDYFEVRSDLYSEGDQKTVGRRTDGASELVIFENGGTRGSSNNMQGIGTGTGNLGKAADLSAYAIQGIIYLSEGVQSALLIGVGGTIVIPERKIDGHILNVDRLPKGAYILKMVGGDNRIVVRKIIL